MIREPSSGGNATHQHLGTTILFSLHQDIFDHQEILRKLYKKKKNEIKEEETSSQQSLAAGQWIATRIYMLPPNI